MLQSVAVVYARLGEYEDDGGLEEADLSRIHSVQVERHLAYTETRYTREFDPPLDLDNHRLHVPCEVLTYELTSVEPVDQYFTLDELRGLRLSDVYQADGTPVTDIPYHQIQNGSGFQKRLVEHVRMLFFNENMRDPLSLGTLNSLGLPYETYKLALTDALLTAVLGAKLTDDVLSDLRNLRDDTKSGYLSGDDLAVRFPDDDTGAQYWIRSGIAGFADDAAEHFYLPEEYTDPFEQTTELHYDPKDLYIESSRDPVGNTVRVRQFDYRVLTPREMEDINDNLSEVAFDILGMPTAMALKGKGNEGDTLHTFSEALLNPNLDTKIAFFEEDFDLSEASDLLGDATARHIYDFGEMRDADGSVTYGHRPASAAGILRERHVAWEREPGRPARRSPLQVAFEYSDGGGNVLVKKIQAEPDDGGDPRWIESSRIILNNKGKPVKQYEPSFTDSHRYSEPLDTGVTPIMYYDAPGRLIRTELPDGAFSRVEFSPWHVTSYDPSDTVLEFGNAWYAQRRTPTASAAEQRATQIAEKHAATPATVFLDSLGREVISVAHNRVPDDEPRNDPLLNRPWHDEMYVTFTKLDAEGKPLWIRDARGNLVMQYIIPVKPTRAADELDPRNPETIPIGTVPCYDIAGNLLFQHSMDAGDRWMLAVRVTQCLRLRALPFHV